MLLNGMAPLPGQIITLPTLADTFRSLGEKGKEGFYKGRVAEAIVELIQSKGGVMDLEDLSTHESSFVEPIKYTYGGSVTVYEVSEHSACITNMILTEIATKCPPNGQGEEI
jgi:gamma-glutamyltranspeptidase / glutathione hydrolase